MINVIMRGFFLCLLLLLLRARPFPFFPKCTPDLEHDLLDFERKQILYLFGILLRLRGCGSK